MVDLRALLILDIDETLLRATPTPLPIPCDYQSEGLWVYKRPHVDDFLLLCRQHFRIAVWTSANAGYANEIFSQVFPTLPIEFIYSKNHCLNELDHDGKEVSVKPLPVLQELGFDLKRILMIDDSPEKHYRNPGNLIAVRPYLADVETDDELFLLRHYLHAIKDHHDFPGLCKQQWRQYAVAG